MVWMRKNIEELEAYQPGFQPKEPGFIKLNTNENPYPPSPRVAEIIRGMDVDTLRLYPQPFSDRLREKIASVYDFPVGNIIVGNGSDELLSMALSCSAGPGDRVIFPFPSYSLFKTLTRIQGAEPISIELEEDFSLPPAFFSEQGAIKMLASPNSPTGTVYPIEIIDRLAEECDGILLLDEAYVDFADGSSLELVRKYSNLLVTRTLSKSYSLAGLRVGYAFAQEEIIEGLGKVKDSYNLNRISALAAGAALDDQEYFRENIGLIREERLSLKRALEEMDFEVYPSGANFLLARVPGGRAREIYEKLMVEKILVRYFDLPRLDDCLRISVGTGEEMRLLIETLSRII